MSRSNLKHFSEDEKQALLNLKGVGPTVIQRLEELGYKTLSELRNKDPRELANDISEQLGVICWRNSPQAIKALEKIVLLADVESVK